MTPDEHQYWLTRLDNLARITPTPLRCLAVLPASYGPFIRQAAANTLSAVEWRDDGSLWSMQRSLRAFWLELHSLLERAMLNAIVGWLDGCISVMEAEDRYTAAGGDIGALQGYIAQMTLYPHRAPGHLNGILPAYA